MSGVRRIWHYHGLSLVLLSLFLASMIGQTWTGWFAYNQEQSSHGDARIPLLEYLQSGHFGEATFENWESEFLQMSFYVLLTVWLFQLGSSESKRPDVTELVDLDPRDSASKSKAPWPVRRGGIALRVFRRNSGSSPSRTGRASSCLWRRWSRSQSCCGSAARRNRSPWMPRSGKPGTEPFSRLESARSPD